MSIKQKFAVAVALIFSVMLLASFIYSPSTALASTTNNNEFVEQISFQNNDHYLPLSGATEFAFLADHVFLLQNNNLVSYNTQSKVSFVYGNVINPSHLTSTQNYIFLLSNNTLHYSLRDLNLTSLQINANMYAIQEGVDGTILIATVYQNKLNLYTFNDLLELQSHIIAPFSTNHALDLTFTNKGIAVLHTVTLNSQPTNFRKISFANIVNNNLEQELPDTLLLNKTKLNFATMYDKNIIALSSNNNDTLELISSDNLENEFAELKVKLNQNPSYKTGDLLEIKDFVFYQNNLFVLDSANQSIQKFSVVNSEEDQLTITDPQTFIASSGYDFGRFNEATQLLVPDDETIIVADPTNNRVQVFKNNLLVNTPSLYNLSSIISVGTDEYKQLYLLTKTPTNAYEILQFSKNYDLQKTITLPASEDYLALSVISDQQILLLTTTNLVYKLEVVLGMTQTTLIAYLNQLNLNGIANKITKTNNENYIITFTDQNNGVAILNESFELIDHLTNKFITDFALDFYNNIIAKTNLGYESIALNEQNKLVVNKTKTYNNTILVNQTEYEVENNITKNAKLVALDKATGNIYIFSTFGQQIAKITDTELVSPILNFEYDVNVESKNLFTTMAKIATVTNINDLVYEYPGFIGKSYELTQQNKLFVLSNNQNSDFSQVLFEYNNQLITGYIKKTALQISEIEQKEFTEKLKATENIKLLTLPTTQTFKNQILVHSNQNKNVVLTPISDAFVGLDGFEYYAVLLENNQIAYTLNYGLVFYEEPVIVPVIKANKTVYDISGIVKVYESANQESPVVDEIASNHEVLVEENSEHGNFTFIKYLDESNNVKTGYILTTNLKSIGLNERTITSVILAISGVFLLVGVAVYAYLSNKKHRE